MTRQNPEVPGDPGALPVIAGAASVANHPAESPMTTLGMMEQALAVALADAAGHGAVTTRDVARTVGLVVAPRGTWRDADPGRAALVHCGGPDTVRSVITEIGVLQYTAVHRAFAAVAAGEVRTAVVLGAEAKWSADRHDMDQDPRTGLGAPDEVIQPRGDILHRLEIDKRLVVPAQQYALIESAIARRLGRTEDEHIAAVAALWAEGSHEAATRRDAWRTDPFTLEGLLSGEGGNRIIATPYRRSMVSSWNVDQSVALVITSAATAREWGLHDDQVVGLVGSATSDHMVPLVARADLTGCPAFSLGAAAIEASTGIRAGDADLADLYSCFPSAVEVAAREIGWRHTQWTLTGGMAMFGGPFNSYALHGIAAMADALRRGRGDTGVTTCVSGILTKGGVAVWRRGPAPAVLHDVTDEDRAARTALEVIDELGPDAEVVAATTVPGQNGDTTFQIVEAGGRRSLRALTT